MGHHAVVSGADYRSQRAVLEVLAAFRADSWVVCEEAVTERVAGLRIGDDLPVTEFGRQGAFFVDELDGSSSFATGHYEWSVSVAYVDALVHRAAAVYAPAIGGGWLFQASRGQGAFLASQGTAPVPLRVSPARMRDAYVLVGPDMLLGRYPLHNRLAVVVADACRTMNASGSCALALGLVSAGRAQLLIQPPQCPWDWAAGRLLVEEAGGVVLFYELVGSRVVPVRKLEPRHYDPAARAVGLLAGDEELAREALALLTDLGT
jgi:fructose-1,6-bisphosphatase/inositol monophosphatase family enzyme